MGRFVSLTKNIAMPIPRALIGTDSTTRRQAPLPRRVISGLQAGYNSYTPRSIEVLIGLIVISIILPVAKVPGIEVSLSFFLFLLVFLEMRRSGVRWSFKDLHPIPSIAWLLSFVTVLSFIVNTLAESSVGMAYKVLLMVRLPYWILCMVITGVVVAHIRNPQSVVRAAVVGTVGLAIVRIGAAWLFGVWWGAKEGLPIRQNVMGLIFSAFWPWVFAYALETGREKRWVIVLPLVVALAIVINGSRGNWVSSAVATVIMVAWLWKYGRGLKEVLRMWVFVGLAGVAAMWLWTSLAPEVVRATYERRFSTFETLDADKSYQLRVAMRRKAWQLFADHPILGIGPGMFKYRYAEFEVPRVFWRIPDEELNRRSAHCAYLEWLAETGIVGGGGLTLLVLSIGWLGVKNATRGLRRGMLWPVGTFCGFIGMSIHLWVVSAMMSTMVWVVYGVIGGISVWLERNVAKAGGGASEIPWRRIAMRGAGHKRWGMR